MEIKEINLGLLFSKFFADFSLFSDLRFSG